MEKENVFKVENNNVHMQKEGKKKDIWDIIMTILIWLGIAALLIWAILKGLGVLHSPVWIDMIPYYGIGVAGAGSLYKLGKIKRSIEVTEEKVNELIYNINSKV